MKHLFESFHNQRVRGRRVKVLIDHLTECVPLNSTIVDIGTGDGAIAAGLMKLRTDLRIKGLEVHPRSDCAVPCKVFDGETLPFDGPTYDYAMLIDVLHHTENPRDLLCEALRIVRKGLIIKDHLLQGWLAGPILRFMDEVSNRRFGVNLPHNYQSPAQWQAWWSECGLSARSYREDLDLYPPWADWIFGRSMHFLAVLEADNSSSPSRSSTIHTPEALHDPKP